MVKHSLAYCFGSGSPAPWGLLPSSSSSRIFCIRSVSHGGSGSWGGEVPFKALPDLVYEYACHEGNYALSNVLSGARAQERENRDRK